MASCGQSRPANSLESAEAFATSSSAQTAQFDQPESENSTAALDQSVLSVTVESEGESDRASSGESAVAEPVDTDGDSTAQQSNEAASTTTLTTTAPTPEEDPATEDATTSSTSTSTVLETTTTPTNVQPTSTGADQTTTSIEETSSSNVVQVLPPKLQKELVDELNRLRSNQGLGSVQYDQSLANEAEDCARLSLARGTLEHCDHEVLWMGGLGVSPQQLLDAWFNSELHKQALTYPSSTQAGGALVIDMDTGVAVAAIRINY